MIVDISARFRIPAFSVWRGRSSPWIRNRGDLNRLKLLVLLVAAIACGRIGWSGEMLLLPVATVFPTLWAMSPSRMVAAFVSAGYFLAASRGLPQGVANFYAADVWPGLLLWVAASASFVGVHAVLWTARRVKDATGKRGSDVARALRYLVSMVLTGLPPFGITGWAHPLTAAGLLFPGWGWWGMFALATGLLVTTTRFWPAAAITLWAFWLWSTATWTPLNLPEGWRSVDFQ